MEDKNKTFQILRYRPETDEAPHFETYTVSYRHETSILDALNDIRDHQAPDFSYRSSCRMAVCGSCAMMINGEPHLACKTFVRDYEKVDVIRLEPLENFPIERDLICDISDMIEKIERVKPYIIPLEEAKPLTEDYVQSPRQLEKYRQFAQCINCGCCYAACPQYKLNKEFIGPAALSLLYRYNHDSRDGGTSERMKIVNQESGVWSCTMVGYCSDVCPKLVDPTSAIQMGKGASAFDYIKHFFKKDK